MRLQISKRSMAMPASPIRKLYLFADSAKQRGVAVHHLNIGQPDLPTPRVFFKTVRTFSQKVVAYAPSAGYTEVIKAWSSYFHNYGLDFNDREILVATGASEAISFALIIVANAGDEVIVFEPLYPNYISFAQMTGVKLKPVTLDIKNGFHLPVRKEIERHITAKTKAIIVCNPSNPTGTVFSKNELGVIAGLAKKHHLFIIADETYREFVFNGHRHISLMEFPGIRENVIMVDSVSKKFNICGARIGCLASKNKNVVATAFKFAQGRLAAPTIEQLGVAPLLRKPAEFTGSLVRGFERRRDRLVAALKSVPDIKFAVPEGAFYIMLSLPVSDAEHFCRWLLEKYHYQKETVMLAPGEGFYVTKNKGQSEVRIAYVLDSKLLVRSVEILRHGLREYHKQFGKKE